MADWEQRTRQDYEDKGFANRSGYGQKPALLIVDFINGFTDPSTPLGGDFSSELAATAKLLEAFRKVGLPIIFTTITYKPDLSDGGMFVKKVPSLAILQNGSPMVEIDQRIAPWPGEYSAFHPSNPVEKFRPDSHILGTASQDDSSRPETMAGGFRPAPGKCGGAERRCIAPRAAIFPTWERSMKLQRNRVLQVQFPGSLIASVGLSGRKLTS